MGETYTQSALFAVDTKAEDTMPDSSSPSRSGSNVVAPSDKAFHDWYRFVLSFPPHLVRDYLRSFGLSEGSVLLDPFCGTGTTVVEAKLHHVRGIGVEANPFPRFAGSVKVNWSVNPDLLWERAQDIAAATQVALPQEFDENSLFHGIHNNGEVSLRDLPAAAKRLLITDSISPLPLHKTLVLLEHLRGHTGEPYYAHLLLALGKCLVTSIGNLRFGPEVGVGKQKHDAPVVAVWLAEAEKMAWDLRLVQGCFYPDAKVLPGDARMLSGLLEPESIDAVITSPPYPNEKDYTRTTRLESVLLGFYNNNAELRALKKGLVRSNTRSVYKEDDDDRWISAIPAIRALSDEIERRRIELGKTSGFEKLYGRLTRLYFGGMARHLAELKGVLRPGAQLAYVVGDQASYFRVMIRTGKLLAEIAERLGYEVVRIDLFRTRFATAMQSELREEVVVLRQKGTTGWWGRMS